MVTAFLLVLFRKHLKKYWPSFRSLFFKKIFKRSNLLLFGFLLLLLLKVFSLKAQQKELVFEVLRNGKTIGWLKIQKIIEGNTICIRMQTQIKARLLFSFLVNAKEEVIFNQGIITYSSQYRTMNGDVKENKEMKLTVSGYEIHKNNTIERLPYRSLQYNMLSMYFQEPRQLKQIYSDSYQQLIDIKSIPDGGYKCMLPDGNTTTFYYKNAICYKMVSEKTFCTVEFRLK